MKIKLSKSQWESMNKKSSFSPEDIEAIKKVRDKSTISLNDSANKLKIIKDVINLSSGTIGTLTGFNDYETIGDIQNDFVVYVKTLIPTKHWEHWMDAWKEFSTKHPSVIKKIAINKTAISENTELILGRVVITPSALSALKENKQYIVEFLERHKNGDWGDVPEEDRESNNKALENNNERILSSYQLKDGTKIWIITEWNRSVTTILLPDEY